MVPYERLKTERAKVLAELTVPTSREDRWDLLVTLNNLSGISRDEYESLCIRLGVAPADDSDIEYDRFGDFTMYHYTEDKNIAFGLNAILKQQRARKIARDQEATDKPTPKLYEPPPLHAYGKHGTRFEDCDCCGAYEVEVDNMTSLCKKCHGK